MCKKLIFGVLNFSIFSVFMSKRVKNKGISFYNFQNFLFICFRMSCPCTTDSLMSAIKNLRSVFFNCNILLYLNVCYNACIFSLIFNFNFQSVSLSLSGTAMITAVSNATKTLTAVSVYEVASSPTPKK